MSRVMGKVSQLGQVRMVEGYPGAMKVLLRLAISGGQSASEHGQKRRENITSNK